MLKPASTAVCNLCQSPRLERLGPVGRAGVSVTSDSHRCGLQAVVYGCPACGQMQKRHLIETPQVIQEIYESYTAHQLSAGGEQLIFPSAGEPRPRTYHALEQCAAFLPTHGQLLDIGTGNGAMLKSAAQLLPHWGLYASDISDRYRATILSLPQVQGFTSGSLDQLPQTQYDLITLWHVLEHVPEPAAMLQHVSRYLSPTGLLLLQVPDLARAPFDLAVIDHGSHFTLPTLTLAARLAGLEVVLNGGEWVHNCLTLLLRPRTGPDLEQTLPAPGLEPGKRRLAWLNQTRDAFEAATHDQDYLLFGTGMASLWLLGEMSRPPIGILDEDDRKRGAHIDGIPVYTPAEAPQAAPVVLPFTQPNGQRIHQRLRAQAPAGRPWPVILAGPLEDA